MQPNVWSLIEAGKFCEACSVADTEFGESGSIFPLRNKLFALLELGKYEEAITTANKIINAEGDSQSEYIFLGVAYWLKGDFSLAIQAWQAGTNTRYADAAGGVVIPMLLYYAALKNVNAKLKEEAIATLKNRIKSRRINNWPGPIAQYLLNKISEAELRSKLDRQPSLYAKQACQVDFFVAVKQINLGDKKEHLKFLSQCTNYGIQSIVNAEFHLAKGELSKEGIK